MSKRYRRVDTVVSRDIAGERMLVPVTGNLADMQRIFVLDEVSSVVWDLIEEPRSLQDLVDAVLVQFDVDEATARADIEEFVAELKKQALLADA